MIMIVWMSSRLGMLVHSPWPPGRPPIKTPSRTRAGSASPAERALLDGIFERLAALHRFGPCLLQPVVPYRRHICVLNQHLRRRKFKPLGLQLDDLADLGQKGARKRAKERPDGGKPRRVPIEHLRDQGMRSILRRHGGEAQDLAFAGADMLETQARQLKANLGL